jgi:hypothetical protein
MIRMGVVESDDPASGPFETAFELPELLGRNDEAAATLAIELIRGRLRPIDRTLRSRRLRDGPQEKPARLFRVGGPTGRLDAFPQLGLQEDSPHGN